MIPSFFDDYLRFPGTDLDNFPDFVAFAGETPARIIRIQFTSLKATMLCYIAARLILEQS
jgi:hypothetical protein